MGMDLDITGLKDLLMSKALAELPKQTIDQVTFHFVVLHSVIIYRSRALSL